MDIIERLFKYQITLNNIKAHNFTIADYPLSEKEAEVVIEVLEQKIKKNKSDKKADELE